MSTRGFDTAAGGFLGEGIEPVAFAMMDFEGDPRFVHTSIGMITWGGEDWFGIGNFGAVEPIGERLGYAPARTRWSLSPVAEEYLAAALMENTWGRLAELYAATWNPDTSALTRDPYLLIRGRMGPPEVVIGGKSSGVSIVVEDIRTALDRVNGLRVVMADHQLESAGDTLYEWLPKMLDHKFVFNGGAYGGNNAGGVPTQPPVRPPGTFIWPRT